MTNKTDIYVKVIIPVMLIFITSFLIINNDARAQTEEQVVYDYVILIDTSESMLAGEPSLFSQVQNVSQNFVRQIQENSNLVLYSFDRTYTKIGEWEGVTASDKDEVISSIGDLKATGQYTALWDTVCEGISQMEEMGKTGGQHIQLLISYTDGKNNIGTKTPAECLARYQELQKDGYSYWIYNAIGGIDVPEEILTLKDIIGIVDTDNPVSIRVVHIQPLTLNLGNLFLTGKSNPESSCLLFWSSDPANYGKGLFFNEPPIADRSLPSGVAIQICEAGGTCSRKIEISPSKSCLDVELVNFRQDGLSASDFGDYTVTLPLQIPYAEPQDRVFLVPNKLQIRFNLDYPPTSTPLPTTTATPLPTATLLPTHTPTPLPGNTVINCGGIKGYYPDAIKLTGNSPEINRELNCEVVWSDYFLPQSMTLTLDFNENEQDNQLLGSYVWINKNNVLSKKIELSERDTEFSLLIKIPRAEWSKFGKGKNSFTGHLALKPINTQLTGDVTPEQLAIPIAFQVKKPVSPWFFIVPGLLIVAIALILSISKSVKANKPPKFPAYLTYKIFDTEKRVPLEEIEPIVLSNKLTKIIVGQGDSCQVKLPANEGLAQEYFALLAEKSNNEIEISIEPLESVQVNGFPVTSRKPLKKRDEIKVGEISFRILIDN